ncbi:MAG: EamA family transporter RarD [Halieaceae bacterium]|nr:EamA family transporter RarD [Halieaceae bacterium]
MNPGLAAAVAAHLIWGFAPLYWVQTGQVPALDIVAHRVLWSLLLLVLLLAALGRLRETLGQWLTPRTFMVIAVSATAQACNWGVFVWSVTHDHAAEASLGYFLLPLVNVAIGVMVLREAIDRAQAIAIALAALGMSILVWDMGGLPWVALSVSVSFGIYTLVRKLVHIGAIEGLAMEVAFLSPLALAWMWMSGGASFGDFGTRVDLFLAGAGVITTVPLVLYVAASHRLALTAMGLTFYIGPSCQLLVAIFIFEEPLNTVQLGSFVLVWLGLAAIIADTLRRYRNVRGLRGE